MKIPNWLVSLLIKSMGGGTMFDKVKASLQGKKTYLSAAALVIAALMQFSADGDAGALINKIIEAVALCSVRSAIPQ